MIPQCVVQRAQLERNRMLVHFSWVVCACLVVATAIMFWMLHRAFQFGYVQSTSPAINDDASAARSFLSMLNEAQESLIIYDDGDDSDGSLYNDRRVIEAVQEKLNGNPLFEVRCLFNCNDDLLFRRELEWERQVDVRIRSNSEREDGIRYKIIDGGPKAFVSRHVLSSKEGSYKIVECTRVPPRYRLAASVPLLGSCGTCRARASGTRTQRQACRSRHDSLRTCHAVIACRVAARGMLPNTGIACVECGRP